MHKIFFYCFTALLSLNNSAFLRLQYKVSEMKIPFENMQQTEVYDKICLFLF